MSWERFKSNVSIIKGKVASSLERQRVRANEANRVRKQEKQLYQEAYNAAKLKALRERGTKEGRAAGLGQGRGSGANWASIGSGISNYFQGVAENAKRQDELLYGRRRR